MKAVYHCARGLAITFAIWAPGLACAQIVKVGSFVESRLEQDIEIYGGRCTRCPGEDPSGWNCHGAVSHALGGPGGTLTPGDLGLRWGERYQAQPIGEDGSILPLSPYDIVVFGIEVPDPPPGDFEKVTGFPHSAVATGEGAKVWQVGENPARCGGCPFAACLNVVDANAVLRDPIYGGKCVVFPGSAFGDGAEGIASTK